jgi:hypothetical protein
LMDAPELIVRWMVDAECRQVPWPDLCHSCGCTV